MTETNTKGAIISFMGIKPKPGLYWTQNRHNCSGKAQVNITIKENGHFITECPCCLDNPTVIYESGLFSVYNGVIIT